MSLNHGKISSRFRGPRSWEPSEAQGPSSVAVRLHRLWLRFFRISSRARLAENPDVSVLFSKQASDRGASVDRSGSLGLKTLGPSAIGSLWANPIHTSKGRSMPLSMGQSAGRGIEHQWAGWARGQKRLGFSSHASPATQHGI